MKKIITCICAVAVLFSATGCNKKQNIEIALEHPNYSYESKAAPAEPNYSWYDEEYLTKLNETYQLDELVKGCSTEFEKVQAVTKWVTNLWAHNGMNEPEQSDPLFILDEITKNGKQFRCVEYGTVIYGCLLALDIPARTIGLKMKDVETIASGAGHVATEVFLKDLDKWIFVDGQWGTIPTLDDVPLNAVEFSAALKFPVEGKVLSGVIVSDAAKDESSTTAYKYNYFVWIKPYLYYFDTSYAQDDKTIRTMLTPTDAEHPTIFQVEYPLDVDIYTDSVVDFYPIP